jgi:hypothetical protein
MGQSVTHAQGASVNVGFKFGPVFSAGGSVSVNDGTTQSTTTTTSGGNTVTTTRSGSQSVPSKKFLLIQLETWPVYYTVSFRTSVTVDGALSDNDKGYRHLSDIFSEAERTFSVSGVITADDASSGVLAFYDVPYDATKCSAPTDREERHSANGSRLILVPEFVPDPTTKLKKKP